MQEPSHGQGQQRFTFQNDHPQPRALLPSPVLTSRSPPQMRKMMRVMRWPWKTMAIALAGHPACGLLWEPWSDCSLVRLPTSILSDLTAQVSSFPHA